MRKMFKITLLVVLMTIISIQPALAVDYLDMSEYANYEAYDSYPSNNNKVTYDYVGTLYKYGAIAKDDKSKYSSDSEVSMIDAIEIVAKIKYIDKYGNDNGFNYRDNLKNKSNNYELLSRIKITRAVFAMYLDLYLKNSYNNPINSIEITDIKDIKESSIYSEAVVNVYRYGLMGDGTGYFHPNDILTYQELAKACSRLINPYYRLSLSMYEGDRIEIQSDIYPMYYKNYDEGLFIDIVKERRYDTDCYIAHIVIDDPAHFKTYYSNLEWSNYGTQAFMIDERVNPIFLVNGDFRSPYIVKDQNLGIIRNSKLVREKKFNNVLGMTQDGHLIPVKADGSKEVFRMDVRDTWTFGPWLLNDSKIINGLDNKALAPRTFFGEVLRDDGKLEYYLCVCEGRSRYDRGMTMFELGTILDELGCDIGYNLDGGGSSVMMFDGKLLSRPSGGYFRADIDYIYIK